MFTLTPEEVELARQQNEGIISKIVAKTSGPLYNLAFQMVKNKEDAEDVLQESYIKMVRNLPNFRAESTISTWLYRIVTNTALERIRKEKTGKSMQDFHDEEFQEIQIHNRHALDEFNPESTMMNHELKTVMMKYLQELPEQTRLVFILRDQEHLSLEEIINITGDTEWSVKGRLKRARAYLREKLASYVKEGVVSYGK